MNNRGLSHSTCQVYLSAIKSLHVMNDVVPPNLKSERIRLALKAIRNKGPEPKHKKPITFNLLKQIWSLLKKSKNEYCIKAILSLAFFGGMRGAEYLSSATQPGPKIQQIWFQKTSSGTKMIYQVTKSKTKQNGFQIPFLCSGNEICAVCAMEQYLIWRSTSEQLIQEDSLFTIDGRTVSKNYMNCVIKKLIKSMGTDTQGYSLHSIRYGATTTAAQNHFHDWELRLVGGWSSNTYNRYINTQNTNHRARFSRRLVQ